MWLTEAPVDNALAAVLFFDGPQTPSLHLRPVRDLYLVGGGGLKLLAAPVAWRQPLAPVRIDRLPGLRTDDSGAKLDLRRFAESHGTGSDLLLYQVRGRLNRAWPGAQGNNHQMLPASPHTRAVQWIQDATSLSEERVGDLLGVSRIAIRNWKAGKPIKEANRRRLLETKDVLLRAWRQHPSRDELVAWLDTPDPEAGVSPARLLERGELNHARLLAVMSPTSVVPTPAWARRPVPATWRGALEQPERPGEFLDSSS